MNEIFMQIMNYRNSVEILFPCLIETMYLCTNE